MMKFNILKHAWKFLFFILWIGDIEKNASFAMHTDEQLRNIMTEIITPFTVLGDEAIQYFIQFANQRMSEIGKNYNLIPVAVTQIPEECNDYAKFDEDDVQIMYGGSGGDVGGEHIVGHYICVHYLHELKRVHIYDSLQSKFNTYRRLMKVLPVLYPLVNFTKLSSLKRITPETRQKDVSSCGLFSIAYATTLIFGEDPATYKLQLSVGKGVDQSTALRAHLSNMLTTGNFSIFPSADAPMSTPVSVVQKPNKTIETTTSKPVKSSKTGSSSRSTVKKTKKKVEATSSWSGSQPSESNTESEATHTTFGLVNDIDSHKYMSVLLYKNHGDDSLYMTSATIVSPNRIVTAAQNVVNRDSVTLAFNTLDTDETIDFSSNQKIDVSESEIYIHPGYDANSSHANDLAVIVLKKPLSNVSEIEIVASNYTAKQNDMVTMLGFSNSRLSYINTKVADFVTCRYSYWERNNYRVLEEGKQICVSTGNNYIGTGWIGGAVVTSDNKLLGIMSYDYDGLPEVCTLITGSNSEFIKTPKGFIRKYNKK
ncbi:uncharacterized protein LOC116343398 [Contarinia nasturtii]|uniref:uncharacterized protein LOC116343398 n=1 Tax=Contarinia nasturtii TaxID=265458 RepID=UPI0012D3911E|nr:uncharacterized protein LOC116343398 [Contarinia nasturtii]